MFPPRLIRTRMWRCASAKPYLQQQSPPTGDAPAVMIVQVKRETWMRSVPARPNSQTARTTIQAQASAIEDTLEK